MVTLALKKEIGKKLYLKANIDEIFSVHYTKLTPITGVTYFLIKSVSTYRIKRYYVLTAKSQKTI